jgi:hypothetical protein
VREVTLSALLAADPGAATPDPLYTLLSGCPSVADPVCLALKAHGPTPSADGSSSSSARLPPCPSSCRLPSMRKKIEDYRMARYE